MYVYSVWDKVMNSFAPPFVAKNDNVAIRNFMFGAKKLPNVSDLQLFRLGVWSDEDIKFPFNPSCAEEIPINLEVIDE